MNYSPINIGILLQPSIRSLAYISVFNSLRVLPNEVYILKGFISKLEELKIENRKFNYSRLFFDLNINTFEFLRNNNVKIIELDTDDINSVSVHKALCQSSNKYIIFTGGGILNKETLEINKKFIHIHSGIVPNFRGSTCFYYSILEKNNLGSSAIFLDEKLDSGNLIEFSNFQINYYIRPDQTLFMDYILDPFIRSYTLKKVLIKFIAEKEIKSQLQKQSNKETYYIAHPLLRHLAINKINKNYNPKHKKGIFEII